MAIHPTQTRRERILCYGPPGSGKSKSWRDIADWIYKTKATAHVYACDSDNAWEAQCPSDDHLDGIVTVANMRTWDDYKGNLEEWGKKASREDWLVLDMGHHMWSKTQEAFFDKAFGKDIDEFFLEARKTGTNVGGEYGVNWNVINKMYGKLVDYLREWPGNLLVCCPAEDIHLPDPKGRGGDDPKVLSLFGKFGVKPTGQKNLPYEVHTVLLCQQSPDGWVMSTVKERTSPEQPREYLAGEKVTDFVSTYLIKVGQWRL